MDTSLPGPADAIQPGSGDAALTALVGSVGCYVAIAIVSNVMSARIVSLGGMSLDAGTLLYPLAFTVRDIVHKAGGLRVARLVVVLTAGLNLAMVGAVWLAARLPADAAVGAQSEFGQVLLPVWRIVVGSLLAQVVAELVDTEVYDRVVRRWGEGRQWARVVVSNTVSIPLDTVIFAVVAFAGEAAGASLASIVWSNIAIKSISTLLTWPLIYWVPTRPAPVTLVARTAGG